MGDKRNFKIWKNKKITVKMKSDLPDSLKDKLTEHLQIQKK